MARESDLNAAMRTLAERAPRWGVALGIGAIVVGAVVLQTADRTFAWAGWPIALLGGLQIFLVLGHQAVLFFERLRYGRIGDVDALLNLSPQGFERFVADRLRSAGGDACAIGGSSDGGVDVVLSMEGRRVAVQCKRYREKPVGVRFVRELAGVVAAENRYAEGWLVTTSRFTDEAQRFAKSSGVRLIGPRELLSERSISRYVA